MGAAAERARSRGLADTGRMRAGECVGRSAASSPSPPPGDWPPPAPAPAPAPFPVAPPTLSDVVGSGPGPVGDGEVRALPPLRPDHGRRFRADHAEGAGAGTRPPPPPPPGSYGEGGGGIKGTWSEDDCGCGCVGLGFLCCGGVGLGRATSGGSVPKDAAGSSRSSRKRRGCRAGGASCAKDTTPAARVSNSALQEGHQREQRLDRR